MWLPPFVSCDITESSNGGSMAKWSKETLLFLFFISPLSTFRYCCQFIYSGVIYQPRTMYGKHMPIGNVCYQDAGQYVKMTIHMLEGKYQRDIFAYSLKKYSMVILQLPLLELNPVNNPNKLEAVSLLPFPPWR